MSFKLLLFLLSIASFVAASPLAYGICQSGCNALVVACFAAAGVTFGTVTAGAGVPAAIIACNARFGDLHGCLRCRWICANALIRNRS
jgi:hypothetical protein